MGKARKQAPGEAVALLADVKPSGTGGGSSVSGTQVRDLNTVISDDQDIVTLDPGSGEFTLGVGNYFIEWSSPAFEAGRNKASLYDSSGIVAEGGSVIASSYGTSHSSSSGGHIVKITGPKTYRIVHYTDASYDTEGLGGFSNSGEDEVYTQVKVTKVG